MSETYKDDKLQKKVKLLRETPHFSGNNSTHDLSDKQAILLVLAGKKPLAKVTSGRWSETAEGRSAGPDDEASLAALCESLGVAYRIQSDEYGTDVTLALDQALVNSYLDAEERDDPGVLFGYPQTAIDAFDTDSMVSLENQEQMMIEANLPIDMPQFRLSKQHAYEELAILKDWQDTLTQYDLV